MSDLKFFFAVLIECHYKIVQTCISTRLLLNEPSEVNRKSLQPDR